MRTLLSAALAGSLVLLGACSKRAAPTDDNAMINEAPPSVPTVTIDQLDQLIATHAAQAVDANGPQTRKKMGVIPGAILLTDSDTFAPSELGADKAKPLVFYCANTHCGASHDAAAKARTAGYTDVRVLPDGIAGWVKANKKTAQI